MQSIYHQCFISYMVNNVTGQEQKAKISKCKAKGSTMVDSQGNIENSCTGDQGKKDYSTDNDKDQ